jgi:hypothetical protein
VAVRFDPHAERQMLARWVTHEEVRITIAEGERTQAKRGRRRFRRNFPFGAVFRGKRYATKQVEAYAVVEWDDWLVITVISKFF